MHGNPASPKMTLPVLNFNLPRPGKEEMMDEDLEYWVEDDDDADVDNNLMDYVHKKVKKESGTNQGDGSALGSVQEENH